MAEPILVVAAESVTRLDDVAGKVLVAGSHGGIIAAYFGARAGAHALVLNDAGLGMDRAGIAGLAYLEAIGMAAAAVDCRSARIGDGSDMLARGVISHANVFAALCGVVAGQSCRDAAERMRRAAAPRTVPPPYAEGRWRLVGRPPEAGGPPEVWALDSVGNIEAAVFNDAGVGADRIGSTRVPVLGARGIAAVAVDCMSARIGDGRSMWKTGVILHMNAPAAALGATRGMTVRQFAEACIAAHIAAQNRR